MNLSGLKMRGDRFMKRPIPAPVFAYFMQFDSFSSEGRLSDAVSGSALSASRGGALSGHYEQLLDPLSETDALWLYHRHADLIIEWMDAKTSIFTLGYSAAEILVKADKVCWELVVPLGRRRIAALSLMPI